MLARALKLDSTMADAWYNVGALYDMCDQAEDANLAYAKAKENGLADRFARAGMGATPLAMQPLHSTNISTIPPPQQNISNTNNGPYRSQFEVEQQQQQLQQQQYEEMMRLQQEFIHSNPDHFNNNINNSGNNTNNKNAQNHPPILSYNQHDHYSDLANDVDMLMSDTHMRELANDGHAITDDDGVDDDDYDDENN
jgi:hypothetical protein